MGFNASPAFADPDNDNDADLFIGNAAGNTFFFRNTGAAPGVNSSTVNGVYTTGAVINLTIGFSEPVFVDTTGGTPTLQLETGSIGRKAIFISGSGTNTLSFQYTVQDGDSSPDLDQLSSSALELNGGTITDANGNPAILVLPQPGTAGSLSDNADLIIDTNAPVITSSITATAIDDNSGANQIIYTATAIDSTAVSYSLKADNNDDAALFSIADETSGEIILTLNPDFETQSSYRFTVVATDAAGNSSEQSVSLSINEIKPETIVSSQSLRLPNDIDNLIQTVTPKIRGIGNNLDNTIEGNAGKNRLKGKGGNDTLIGKESKDVLTGGRDNDTFIYESINDSGTTRATRDVITDFTADDTIDLSRIDADPNTIGDQAFVFIGSDRFSAIGQARFTSNGLLSLNIDDDLLVDFQVKFRGVNDLPDNSLIL